MKVFDEKKLTVKKFTYVMSDMPVLPKEMTEEKVFFDWMTVFDVGIDVHFAPIDRAYVGALLLRLGAEKLIG